jgi:regulator of sigma E protease
VSIAVSILGLAFLIFIHEAGHFFGAIAVRMRPRGFSIGFGPPLAKIRRNDIDYAIRVVPLGGYVTIPGMTRPQPSDVDAYLGGSVRDAPELVGPAERLKRALASEDFEQAGHELGTFEAVAADANVDKRSLGRGLKQLRDSLSPDAYWRQATWRRVFAIAAGPATNLVFAVVMFGIVLMVAGGKATTKVEEVFADKPASAVGLQPGDRILAINGRPMTPSRITETISGSGGKPVTVVVRRGDNTVVLGPVRPKPEDVGGETVYRLGFRLAAEPLGPVEAFRESVVLSGRLAKEIAVSLGNVIHKEGRKQIASPIGIVDESSSAARQGWENYLAVLAFISLSLGLLNLLPLLPLDGGHIVFALAEKVRGHAIRREIYERVSAVGIVVVLLLFFVGLSNDVGRLGGG